MSEIESFENEVWVAINHPSIGDYSNYEISNFGRVLSRRYRQTNGKKLLKIRKDKKGYMYTVLSKKGFVPKKFRIHRLVALLFLSNPNPEDKPCVNHKIEGEKGKSMNFVFFKPDGSVDEERTTIEWVSVLYNNTYGTRIERFKETLKTSVAWAEGNTKKRKKVFQYSENGELVNVYPSVIETARQTGYNQGSISKCCWGRANTAYNFVWSYTQLTVNQVLDLFKSIKISKLCKKVYQYTTDGEFVNIYPSVKEAAQQTGYCQGNISDCCQSERIAYGYIFRYEPLTEKKIS